MRHTKGRGLGIHKLGKGTVVVVWTTTYKSIQNLTYDNPNAAIVEGTRKVSMVEGRLQDAGWEHNLILVAAVVRVHYGGGSVP